MLTPHPNATALNYAIHSKHMAMRVINLNSQEHKDIRHKLARNSVEMNASEAAFLSAAPDSSTTQPLSINNEEQRSDRKTRAGDVNQGEGSYTDAVNVEKPRESEGNNGILESK